MKTQDIYVEPLKQSFVYWIGQNAQDNFDLIEKSDPEYFWFHVNDSSSAHIVVSIPENFNKKEQRYLIKKGAELAKQHSSRKSDKDVTIVYTKIKNVTRMDIIGTVNIVNPKYITI